MTDAADQPRGRIFFDREPLDMFQLDLDTHGFNTTPEKPRPSCCPASSRAA